MNEIEKIFYDAFIEFGEEKYNIISQHPVGIYFADFVLYPNSKIPAVVEIDGHEYHKTKEQRLNDYKRERFFMKEGYIVIRFMASEVFVDAIQCVEKAIGLSCLFDEKIINTYEEGVKDKIQNGGKK